MYVRHLGESDVLKGCLYYKLGVSSRKLADVSPSGPYKRLLSGISCYNRVLKNDPVFVGCIFLDRPSGQRSRTVSVCTVLTDLHPLTSGRRHLTCDAPPLFSHVYAPQWIFGEIDTVIAISQLHPIVIIQ